MSINMIISLHYIKIIYDIIVLSRCQ